MLLLLLTVRIGHLQRLEKRIKLIKAGSAISEQVYSRPILTVHSSVMWNYAG